MSFCIKCIEFRGMDYKDACLGTFPWSDWPGTGLVPFGLNGPFIITKARFAPWLLNGSIAAPIWVTQNGICQKTELISDGCHVTLSHPIDMGSVAGRNPGSWILPDDIPERYPPVDGPAWASFHGNPPQKQSAWFSEAGRAMQSQIEMPIEG